MPPLPPPSRLPPQAGALSPPEGERRRRVSRHDPPSRRIKPILRKLGAEYPDARCVLVYSSPLDLLVATILSAQCTDAMVNKVTSNLFRKYRRPQDYLRVSEEELQNDIRSTGFFRTKAKHIRGVSQVLVEKYSGEVPPTLPQLVALPGVGRKTANVVISNVNPARMDGIAIDTHVARTARRLTLTSYADPVRIEQDLMRLVPKKQWGQITYLLIDHGRKVCKAPTPRCDQCVLEQLCPSSRL